MKVLRLVLFVLLSAPLLAMLALAVYAWHALPQQQGSLVASNARAEIRIDRDEHGIPTIHAASLADAAYATGILHAQDRLWQLETHRRIGSGRLAEAFGEGALETDRFLRALGVRRTAAAQWARLQGESRELLVAYANGINDTVKQFTGALPPEFLLIGVRPGQWQPEDSLAWAIMMAWDLGGNWTSELLRMRLALQMPVERLNELVPPYPGDAVRATTDYAALYKSLGLKATTQQAWLELPEIAPESGVQGVGSNNWVLAGQRSTTGKPLLANDPHLKLTTPALWYFLRIETPDLKVAGASMPGVPGIVLGQNQHVAWGFTNTGPDVQDLYIEEIKSDDPTRYRTPEGWAAFEQRVEKLAVKGGAEVSMPVRSTRHGPVISDAGTLNDVLGNASRHVLALRWTALDEDIDPMAAPLAMMRARSVAEFTRAAQLWLVPMQNMVVADREGHIGYIAPGRVPVRKADNDLAGLAPALGWDARYDWAGWVPADQTPREFDPARGFIATANQRIHGADYPHRLTSDWELPFRQQRIEQMLATRERHSIDDLAAMQADVRSLPSLKLLPLLKAARSAHVLAEPAQATLASFDGVMAADQAAPLIYWAWLRQLGAALLADEIGAPLWKKVQGRNWVSAIDAMVQRNDARWCDDVATPVVVETCEQITSLAFGRALEELQASQGNQVAQWRWGKAHVAHSEHRPFSRVKALARWFELRTPVGGDTFSVNVSRVLLQPAAGDNARYRSDHGASLRALYDLGDPKQSRFMHSSGQSGIVFSPHFRDFVDPWAAVRYVPLWPDKAAQQRLTIKPGAPP